MASFYQAGLSFPVKLRKASLASTAMHELRLLNESKVFKPLGYSAIVLSKAMDDNPQLMVVRPLLE